MGRHLLTPVKRGGGILSVVSGVKKDIRSNISPEMLPAWSSEDLDTIHDAAYRQEIFEVGPEAEILSLEELTGFDKCRQDRLACDSNEYALKDRHSPWN